MDVLECIKTRRSVREFLDKDIAEGTIDEILGSARRAPSGLNNQPWRFAVVKNADVKNSLAEQTHYGDIIKNAPVCIVVFLDNTAVYDRTKDLMAVGACIENLLLCAHSLGIGAVWLGEILKNKEEVNKILGVADDIELMAVVALGYPASKVKGTERKPMSDLIIKRLR